MSTEPPPVRRPPQKQPCPTCGVPMIGSTPAAPQRVTEAERQKETKDGD